MQKGFAGLWIFVAGVVIVGIAGGAFYLGRLTILKSETQNPEIISSPQPTSSTIADETANWETYISDRYKFSIKHPSNLEADDKNASPPSILFNVKVSEPTGPSFPVFYVSVMGKKSVSMDESPYNRFSQQELNSFFNSQVGDVIPTESAKKLVDPYSSFWYFKRLADTSVDQYLGIVIENNKVWEGGPNTKDRRVIVKRGEDTYMIGTYYETNSELERFEQMLKTFKFMTVSNDIYTCPQTGWENCMPILNSEGQKQCSQEALNWKKLNCPNFEGAAY